jgi:tetratricopeptide (TPR) repeat protein
MPFPVCDCFRRDSLENPVRRFSFKFGSLLAAALVAAAVALTSSCTNLVGEVVRHKNAGDDAYVRRNYTEAEQQYKAAVSKAERLSPTDPLTLICMRSLAQVYVAQGRTGDAEAIYKQRVELAKQSPKDPAYWSTVYDDLATFYILKGRIEEAKPFYDQSIALTKTAYGDENSKVAERVDYYVQLLKDNNYEVEALQLQNRAIAIPRSTP